MKKRKCHRVFLSFNDRYTLYLNVDLGKLHPCGIRRVDKGDDFHRTQ